MQHVMALSNTQQDSTTVWHNMAAQDSQQIDSQMGLLEEELSRGMKNLEVVNPWKLHQELKPGQALLVT